MITIQDLQFTHPGASQPALAGIDLNVSNGSLFGLLGPNGAGKTTLLSLICGLLQVPSGKICIDGVDIARNPQAVRRMLSLVPQEYAFYPALTLAENLAFFAGVLGLRGAQAREAVDRVVAIASLHEALHNRAEQCSGGLKRRLNIAIGLLNRPQLLLLDEPTVGIDPQSRRFILEAIRDINADGTTVIYTSHYMEEVEFLCDDIAIIDHGRVLQHGPLQSLLQGEEGASLHVELSSPLSDEQQRQLLAMGVALDGRRLLIDGDWYPALNQLHQLGIQVNALYRGARNLEDLFIRLTHRSLRD